MKELQEQARERHNVTVDSLTEQLQAAYDEAKSNGQSGAMVQATMGIAKIHGMLVDRTEDLTKAAAEMTPDERTAELDRVQAELDALERPASWLSRMSRKGDASAVLNPSAVFSRPSVWLSWVYSIGVESVTGFSAATAEMLARHSNRQKNEIPDRTNI